MQKPWFYCETEGVLANLLLIRKRDSSVVVHIRSVEVSTHKKRFQMTPTWVQSCKNLLKRVKLEAKVRFSIQSLLLAHSLSIR